MTAAVASLTTAFGEDVEEETATFTSTSPFPGAQVSPPEVSVPGSEHYNVVLVQMESTGSVAMVRPGTDTVPTFTALGEHGIHWTRFYANVPATIKTFLSMQCGIYPAADGGIITETNPTIPCKGIAEYFQERGYRTAFIHGGNFAFTHKLAFLVDRGWEHMLDAKTLPNPHGYETQTWGIDDQAVYDYAIEWIDAQEDPFFLLIAPILSHHPYLTPERWEPPFPTTTKKDCYHNSPYFEDELIGELVAHLKATGRFEDTVFVLVGDHGQAFEEHPYNQIHSVAIYEENVRVPFLISNPRLVPRAQEVDDLAMMPDLLPTLLDVLGFGLDDYQGDGHSLLDPPQDRLIYLHTTFNESKNGLRDGRYKYIHRLGSGVEELYDHGETVNISAQHPARVETYREISTQWQRYSRWQAARTR